MKLLSTIAFTLLTLLCVAQTSTKSAAFYELALPYRPAVVKIMAGTTTITHSINNGNIRQMTYKDLTPGEYSIQISWQGQPTIVRDNVTVKNGQDFYFEFYIHRNLFV
jgi:hypothetical protein